MWLRLAPHPAVALLALLSALPALAAPDASPDAFDRVARALRARLHQTYVARQEIRFAAPGPGGWTRIVVDVARDGARSRLDYRSPADVADLMVADDGFSRRQFQPACRLYQIRRSSPSEEQGGDEVLALLHRNYRCLRRGTRRTNGRDCDLLALTPRHAPGPSRLCWVDRGTDAILRTEEFDAGGRLRYVSAFTALRFAPRLADALFCPTPPAGMTLQAVPPPPADLPYPQARAAAGMEGCPPDWSPPGYRLLRCACLPRPRGTHALLLRYGDGLETLSVYEEARAEGLPPLALQQRMLDDQMGRYGQQAWVRDVGGLRVTVVGDAVLPASVGSDLLRALSPDAAPRLSRALARDFGPGAAAEAETLRRQGWGYDAIAAHLISRSDPDRREDQARAWVAAALAK